MRNRWRDLVPRKEQAITGKAKIKDKKLEMKYVSIDISESFPVTWIIAVNSNVRMIPTTLDKWTVIKRNVKHFAIYKIRYGNLETCGTSTWESSINYAWIILNGEILKYEKAARYFVLKWRGSSATKFSES